MLLNHWLGRTALFGALVLVLFTACSPEDAQLVSSDERAIEPKPAVAVAEQPDPRETPEVTPPTLPDEEVGDEEDASDESTNQNNDESSPEDSGLDAFGDGEGVNPPSIPN